MVYIIRSVMVSWITGCVDVLPLLQNDNGADTVAGSHGKVLVQLYLQILASRAGRPSFPSNGAGKVTFRPLGSARA